MVQSEETGEEQRESGGGGVQVIARAAKILRTLVGRSQGLSLSQIAKEVGLARSTVHRIVLALEAEHFVTTATPNGRIRLGLGLAPLAASVNSELRDELHPYLEQLSKEVDETVDLSVLNEDGVLFIDQIAAPHRLQAVSSIGATFPVYCTAPGKALLAKLPLENAERFLSKKIDKLTPYTVTTREQFWEELKRVRSEGVAYDREEHTMGVCAVSVAIRDVFGNMVAVSIPLPSIRFYHNEQNLASTLLRTCDRISQEFGKR